MERKRALLAVPDTSGPERWTIFYASPVSLRIAAIGTAKRYLDVPLLWTVRLGGTRLHGRANGWSAMAQEIAPLVFTQDQIERGECQIRGLERWPDLDWIAAPEDDSDQVTVLLPNEVPQHPRHLKLGYDADKSLADVMGIQKG